MKVKKKTPSGRFLYRKKSDRPTIARCANCKSPLHGIQRKTQSKMGKLSSSEKRSERPYGGYLCSGCSREVFRLKARI